MPYTIEYPHIGQLIDKLLNKSRISKASLAQYLDMSAGNASYITRRETLDVRTVHQVGTMLEYNFWQHYPFPFDKSKETEMNTKVAELQAQIAAKEKEMELLKMQMEAVKSENAVMKDVIAVLKKRPL